MAYTQVQIDNLEKQIAQAVQMVKHGDTVTTFMTLAEMRSQLAAMKSELNSKPRRTVAAHSRGL